MSETVLLVLIFTVNAVKSIFSFFLLSISVASLIKTLKLEQSFKKAFMGREVVSIPVAAGTGAFSPLCSCGVIPAIAAMLAAGIPLAPIMAFWITSPRQDFQGCPLPNPLSSSNFVYSLARAWEIFQSPGFSWLRK